MRNTMIDGIRGWAALIVIIFHFYKEVFGVVIPYFQSSIFGFVFNGHLAVLVFFILSGDALSSLFFYTKDYKSLVKLTITRYFRLIFLIFITCALVYIIMKLGMNFNYAAGSVVHRENWLGYFLSFEPSFFSFLKYSFYGVFFEHLLQTSYNPFLWTMSVEMLGSVVVFINLFVFFYIKKPIKFLFFQLFFFWVFKSYVALFIYGVLMSFMRNSGFLFRLSSNSITNFLSTFILLMLLVLLSFFSESEYLFFGFEMKKIINSNIISFGFAMLFVFCVYVNKNSNILFSSRISLFLGKISFPLYAIQFVVLISFTSWSILKINSIGCLNPVWMFSIATASVLLSIGLAIVLCKVEQLYLLKLKSIYVNKIAI